MGVAEQFVHGFHHDAAHLAEAVAGEAVAGGFAGHLAGGWFQGDEQAAEGLFAFDGADEVAHIPDAHLAALHRDDDSVHVFGAGAGLDPAYAVDAAIRALAAGW